MIFAGDVAVAHGDVFEFVGFNRQLMDPPWCFNLEGAPAPVELAPAWGLINSEKWTESLKSFSIGPVFIGNNHILDVGDGIRRTIHSLGECGLNAFGAGVNSHAAAVPAKAISDGQEYLVVGFGWSVIGCPSSGKKKAGVNTFAPDTVRCQVRKELASSKGSRIVVVIHGNYEFEKYPQPAHRQLALELIDAGVHAVIFHHPHIVGPVERYKGRLIAYSLGNWAFSYGKFFGGKLRFPDSSFHQIAVELGKDDPVVHHATFSPPSKVTYDFAEKLSSSSFTLKPEFEGFSHNDYIHWFKKHRVKRKGLPIYRDPDARFTNAVRDRWVKGRQILIDWAAKTGLKKMRREE